MKEIIDTTPDNNAKARNEDRDIEDMITWSMVYQ